MNKKAAWMIGILVIVITGAVFYVLVGKGIQGEVKTPPHVDSGGSQVTGLPPESLPKGRYENYSTKVFESEETAQ